MCIPRGKIILFNSTNIADYYILSNSMERLEKLNYKVLHDVSLIQKVMHKINNVLDTVAGLNLEEKFYLLPLIASLNKEGVIPGTLAENNQYMYIERISCLFFHTGYPRTGTNFLWYTLLSVIMIFGTFFDDQNFKEVFFEEPLIVNSTPPKSQYYQLINHPSIFFRIFKRFKSLIRTFKS